MFQIPFIKFLCSFTAICNFSSLRYPMTDFSAECINIQSMKFICSSPHMHHLIITLELKIVIFVKNDFSCQIPYAWPQRVIPRNTNWQTAIFLYVRSHCKQKFYSLFFLSRHLCMYHPTKPAIAKPTRPPNVSLTFFPTTQPITAHIYHLDITSDNSGHSYFSLRIPLPSALFIIS